MKNTVATPPAIQVPETRPTSGWRGQFERPTGLPGSLIGHLMALKNKERSWWVLPLLEIHQDDRVLEIGFGSGMDVRRVSEMVIDGFVAGIDHSEVMVEQARKRNATAIRAGRVELQHGPAARLPYADDSFDKAFSINVAQFWDNPAEVFLEIRRVLRPGGLMAMAVQPRTQGSTERTARETGQKLMDGLRGAGFSEIRLQSKKMKPVSAVCALGVK